MSLLRSLRVPVTAGVAIAKARVPGRIVEAELEQEAGKLVYSFDIKVVGKGDLTEVAVDAQSGAVLTVEPES